MCFAPKISITTAIFEFIVALWMYSKFPKTILNKFLTTIIIILGLYQLSEFMLCTSGNAELWGKVGFISYTFIPVVTLYYTLILTGYKPKKLFIFSPSLLFIAYAIWKKNFIIQGTCSTIFVIVRNTFNYPNIRYLPFSIYGLYYYTYLLISIGIIIKGIKNSKEKRQKKLFYLMITGIILTLVPPLVLVYTIPALGIKFPSMYCQFAMVLTLFSIWGLYVENKSKK